MKPMIAAAALIAAAPLPAFAGDSSSTASRPTPYAQTFAQLDVNHDGLLSFSEAFPNPKLSNNFKLIDANADGYLSPAEIRAALGTMD
jgi:Ca2+-binding EF-hand superfamily protein